MQKHRHTCQRCGFESVFIRKPVNVMCARCGTVEVRARVRATPPASCEICGAHAELRPYGPNGESICFKCGMKDQEAAGKRFMQTVFKEGFDA